jgi:hypothetical protein
MQLYGRGHEAPLVPICVNYSVDLHKHVYELAVLLLFPYATA